jgi:hypothetical protein
MDKIEKDKDIEPLPRFVEVTGFDVCCGFALYTARFGDPKLRFRYPPRAPH